MLSIEKRENETWLECAIRYAKPYGLEIEVKECYEENIKHGYLEESTCAYMACEEWDVIDFKE